VKIRRIGEGFCGKSKTIMCKLPIRNIFWILFLLVLSEPKPRALHTCDISRTVLTTDANILDHDHGGSSNKF